MWIRDYYLIFSSFYLAEGCYPVFLQSPQPQANFFGLSIYMRLAKSRVILILKLLLVAMLELI